MRIQHNIMAMNAYRNYNRNTSALSKNLEKLSSGYKINRAGDDAAGLAISEKMRAQITGLNAAQKNVKDGISLVKTAEGAMQEIQDMLNRMDYLATQSANGTYDNEVDRLNLQKEVDALKTEINRIADSANFNGIKLLDGSMDKDKVTTVTAESAISAITTEKYAPKGASDAFNANFMIERPEAQKTQQNASFTISLDDMSISGADATDEVSLQIGDATLKFALTGTEVTAANKGNLTGSDLAAALAKGGFAAVAGVTDTVDGATTGPAASDYTGVSETGTGAGAYIKIDGHIWKMSNTAGSNAIKFDQVDFMGTTDGEILTPDYHVGDLNVTDKVATNGTIASSGTVNWQAQLTVAGKGIGTSQQAQVNVEVDFSKLKDGDKLIAGEKVYVFKVGKDSTTTAGTGEVLVDLHDILKEESDMADADKQAQAMVKITKDMGDGNSVTWSVGNQGVTDGKGTLTFQSLSTYDGDTVAANKQNIAGNANNEICDMRTEASVMKQFYSERPESGATTSFNLDVTKIKVGDTFTLDGKVFEFTDGDPSSSKNVAINLADLGVATGLMASQTGDVLAAVETAIEGAFTLSDGQSKYDVDVDTTTGKVTLTSNDNNDTASIYENRVNAKIELPTETSNGTPLTLQIGDTSDSFNQMSLSIGDMHTAAMKIDGISIAKQGDAQAAVQVIKDAINYVSSVRGDLGATQNRLEHTANNLSVMAENIQDAESTIRDTDVAEEMMAYTKNNILIQSAQAMLAQANAVPQGVLQLLG